MLITDERFFCYELDNTVSGLENIGENFKKNGLAAAEKQLADYIKASLRPDMYFRIPYYERENAWALRNEDDFKTSERIISGELRSCGVAYKFPDTESVNWTSNPTFNEYKEWTWQLSRHHEWRCLGYCYRQTGDEKYAKAFVDFLMSWCEQAVCPAERTSTLCWRTIEAGIRMTKNWHYAFFAFYKSPYMTDHVIATYMKSICEHGHRLRDFSTSGNWLIMEMAGLSHIAMLYPFLVNAKEWSEYSFGLLANEIDVQVYPDGFQYELTTNYHGVVVQNYYWVINTAKAVGYEIPDALSKNLERMFALFTYIVQPGGHQPDLNDGGRGAIKPWLEIGVNYFPEREDFRYFATDGKEGKLPDFVSIALPYSGMAVMRTDRSKDAVGCFMESAPFGKAHQHEDKLNVLMYAYGKDVLRDMGSYAYDTSEMRKFVLETRSHNCAMVDGKGQNRRAKYKWEAEDINKRSDLKWRFTGEFDVAEGVYNEGYGSDFTDVTHRRKTVFFKKGISGSLPFALVIDRFNSGDGEAHECRVSYQMDIQPYKVEGKTYTADFGDGVTMSVIGEKAPEVIEAQKSPFMGWRPRGGADSEEFEHYHAPCLCYTEKGTEARIVTALYPSNNGAVALKDIVSVDGTKIKLVFADGKAVVIDENDYVGSENSSEKFNG